MKKEVSSDKAKTELTESKGKAGKTRKITPGRKVVADWVPSESERSKTKVQAVERLQTFIRSGRVKVVNINRLIEDGRK